MSSTFIEINDTAIRVSQNGAIILHSPGYAVISDNQVYLGGEALGRSHLNPRMTYNRFWSNPNQDPLSPKSKLARHNADLAYAHLLSIHEQIGKPAEVIFAVPSHYNEEHLSLLLGLANACAFRTVGLVDASVAAAAATADTGPYHHLEIYLHHLTVTKLHAETEVVRGDIEVNDSTGLLGIHDKCANYISDLFIEQSRFDPLRHAKTEQALHDQLPGNLASLCSLAEITFELPFETTRYRIKLKRQQLLQILSPLYSGIIQTLDPEINCLISHRLGNLPGFLDALHNHSAPGTGISIAEDAVFKGCQRNLPHIKSDGDALNFITRLPTVTGAQAVHAVNDFPAPPQVDTEKEAAGEPPSHLLCNGKARALGQDALYLSAGGDINHTKTADSHCAVNKFDDRVMVEPKSELTVFKNGFELTSPATVGPGDIITFAGAKIEYMFLIVEK